MSDTCPNCGRYVAQAAAFCPNCGVKTGEASEEAAAVAAELAGLDVLSPSLSPDVLGELTEKFLAAADEIAYERGGTVIRGGSSAVTIKFPHNVESPAAAAASCALVLRDVTRGLLVTTPKELSTNAYLTAGVDASPRDTRAGGEPETPRVKAERLRRKAGKWVILAGENVYARTAGDFKYVAVGFYQARGGKTAVKIYELKEDRRHLTSAPPIETSPFTPVAGFEEAIENSLAAVLSRRQRRTLFVTGAAGTGKTTWLAAACRLAREKGFRVYASSCTNGRRYRPFSLWAPIWREVFADVAPEAPPAEAPARAIRQIDGPSVIWAPLFARIMGFRPELNPHVADAAPELRHRRIIEVAEILTVRAAAAKPTAVILDDLHLADASSRALLGALLAAPAEEPLALIMASETPDETFGRAADTVLHTRPFTEEEVAAFAGNFAGTGAEEDAALLHAASKGRPEILEQLWLAAREKGAVKIKTLATEGGLEQPTLVAQRLRDFDKRWQRATAALTTLGIPLTDEEVRALAADVFGPDGTAGEAWRYKLYKSLLLRPSLGDREYLCVPPYLREAVLAATAPTPESRMAAAQTAAGFLAERYPGELSARATLELAAGRPARAYDLARENAKQALWLGSPHDAVAQLTAVIRELERQQTEDDVKRKLLPRLFFARAEAFSEAGLAAAALKDLEKIGAAEGELSARRFYSQGQVYLRRGYFREAESSFIEALQSAARSEEYDLVADVELALADLFRQRGDVAKATYELEKSLKADRAPSPRAYRLLAELKYRAGYLTDAVKAARKCISLTDGAQKPITAAEMGLSLAPVFFEYGRISNARGLIAEARNAFGAVGDKRRLCETYLLEGAIDQATEDLATSETAFDVALRLAEEEGYDLCGVEAALGLAVASLLKNDLRGYRRLLVKAKEATTEPESPKASLNLLEATAAYYVSEDYDEAYRLADAASAEYRRTGNAFLYGAAATLAARAALAAGQPDKGREVLGRTDIERRARESKVFFAYYYLAAGELLDAVGDAGQARKRLIAAAAAARELGLWQPRGECYLNLARIAAHENEREKYRRRALWLLDSKGASLLAAKAER
ncbi:MAG TPA: AAA family ATPase [bacterium]|nr:AAA family ATPase [bacterium]